MASRPGIWLLSAVFALACASSASGPGEGYAATPSRSESTQRYVFGWPFVETQGLAPRGGTTRGDDVSLALEPSAAWQALQAPGLSARDRDRAAILALAGDYRTSFDFLEVVLYEPGSAPARPYRSWGTERIDVLESRPDFVSLQHTLVMFVVNDEGETLGPFVQKHWRQDWAYQPREQLTFLGAGTFGQRRVGEDRARGAWSQTVYQVDDSPRFATTGRWTHDGQRSVWEGASAWRPVPRRERSVRQDYQVLAGNHRITLLPTGWVHEQANEKLVLEGGEAQASRGREIGVNRYERIRDFDFSAADAYWQAAGTFWKAIREAWASRLAEGTDVELRNRCSDAPGFQLSFAYAARLEQGEAPADAAAVRSEAARIVECLAGQGGGAPG